MIDRVLIIIMAVCAALIVGFRLFRAVRRLAGRSGRPGRRSGGSAAEEYDQLQNAVKRADEQPLTTGEIRKVWGFPVVLNIEMQNRYIPGRDAYENARMEGNVRSIIFRDAAQLQKLLEEKAGTGQMVAANKEKVTFSQTLGQYVDPVANTKISTNVGVIHYAPEGAYIVPARPMTGDRRNG